MKIFAVLVLAAIVAYASADETTTPTSAPTADEYVGDLQDSEGSEIVRIGQYSDCENGSDGSQAPPQYGPPSCKLGAGIGNPICLAKCIYRGHKGGYCKGKVCTCVD